MYSLWFEVKTNKFINLPSPVEKPKNEEETQEIIEKFWKTFWKQKIPRKMNTHNKSCLKEKRKLR